PSQAAIEGMGRVAHEPGDWCYGDQPDPVDLPRLLRLHGERRKNKADSENDREPDQPHGHLGGGWLAGSLADLNYWRPDLKSWPRGSRTRYSRTWSARPNTDGGIVSPRALAVFKLMTSSNFVGCSMGKSAGFAPLRILST